MSTKKMKKTHVILIVAIIFLVYMATKLSLVSCGEEKFLVINMRSNPSNRSYTLYPKTLHTPEGEIHLKAFTKISHRGGLFGTLSFIHNGHNAEHNLILWGNKLNAKIGNLLLSQSGQLLGFDTARDKTQDFIFEGNDFDVFSLVCNETLRRFSIVSFEDIILADGTRIAMMGGVPARYPEEYIFEFSSEGVWEIYGLQGKFFIGENPAWKESLHLWHIEFEENWGKVIDYRLERE